MILPFDFIDFLPVVYKKVPCRSRPSRWHFRHWRLRPNGQLRGSCQHHSRLRSLILKDFTSASVENCGTSCVMWRPSMASRQRKVKSIKSKWFERANLIFTPLVWADNRCTRNDWPIGVSRRIPDVQLHRCQLPQRRIAESLVSRRIWTRCQSLPSSAIWIV